MARLWWQSAISRCTDALVNIAELRQDVGDGACSSSPCAPSQHFEERMRRQELLQPPAFQRCEWKPLQLRLCQANKTIAINVGSRQH